MANALDAAVLADLLTATPRTYPVVEIQVPTATQYLAETDLGALCEPGTMWVGKILDMEGHPSTAGDRQYAMELVEWSIVVEDHERSLAAVIERKDAPNSPVLVRLISAHATTPPRSITFTGVLWAWVKESDTAWRLRFRPKTDQHLRTNPLRLTVDLAITPFASADVLGTPIPLLYGYHHSFGIGGAGEGGGALNPIYVGQYGANDYRWLLCHGRNAAVYRVLNNQVVYNFANWSHIVETDRGVTLSFVSTTGDLGAGAVTCDAAGYESNGDGTGTVFNEPMDVLQHLMHHFAGYDATPYQSGPWFSGWQTYDGILDLTYRNAARDWLRKRIYCYPRASRYLTENKPLSEYVDEFLSTFGLRAFWLEDGTIAVGPDDVDSYPYVTTDPEWLDWRRHELEAHPFVEILEGLESVNRVVVQYSNVGGSYVSGLEVVDPRSTAEAEETLELSWGPATI